MTDPSPPTIKRQLREMDDYEFEQFVADLWARDGWQTRVSQQSRDMGVDVEAVRTGVIDEKRVFQAKCYDANNPIRQLQVQQYHSLKFQDPDADMAVVVTTSSFTDPAEEWASENNVKLVDADDLARKVESLEAYDLLPAGNRILAATEQARDWTVEPASISSR